MDPQHLAFPQNPNSRTGNERSTSGTVVVSDTFINDLHTTSPSGRMLMLENPSDLVPPS